MLRKTYEDDDTWEYQYDGRAPFRDIIAWCRESFGDQNIWYSAFDTIWLSGDDAAMLFLLRWS